VPWQEDDLLASNDVMVQQQPLVDDGPTPAPGAYATEHNVHQAFNYIAAKLTGMYLCTVPLQSGFSWPALLPMVAGHGCMYKLT
jgi:hypothetical protein